MSWRHFVPPAFVAGAGRADALAWRLAVGGAGCAAALFALYAAGGAVRRRRRVAARAASRAWLATALAFVGIHCALGQRDFWSDLITLPAAGGRPSRRRRGWNEPADGGHRASTGADVVGGRCGGRRGGHHETARETDRRREGRDRARADQARAVAGRDPRALSGQPHDRVQAAQPVPRRGTARAEPRRAAHDRDDLEARVRALEERLRTRDGDAVRARARAGARRARHDGGVGDCERSDEERACI